VKKFVLASTSSLYAGQTMPFVETLPVNSPISPYAASKKAAEVLAYSYHFLYGLDVSIVRYFTVYGPAGRPDMSVFRFIQWIDQGHPIELFGDGTQSRDFTFVDDIARGTILAMRPLGYEIINLGGGNKPTALLEIIEQIEKHLGKKANFDKRPFHQADMKSTWADISKAKRLLGWQPTVSLSDGIARTIDWYRDNLPFSGTIKL
jgi:nucleoside-diphosphate-sugar epimerase